MKRKNRRKKTICQPHEVEKRNTISIYTKMALGGIGLCLLAEAMRSYREKLDKNGITERLNVLNSGIIVDLGKAAKHTESIARTSVKIIVEKLYPIVTSEQESQKTQQSCEPYHVDEELQTEIQKMLA